MLRPNTDAFQFIRSDHPAGAERRLTLDEVLSHPFCKAAGDTGEVDLDICNELDMVVRPGAHIISLDDAPVQNSHMPTPEASRLREAVGDEGRLEPIAAPAPAPPVTNAAETPADQA